MKKLLFVPILILCVQLSSNAQTEKSNFLFSGATDLSSFSQFKTRLEYDGDDSGDHQKTTSFDIAPSIAYTILEILSSNLLFKLL